MLLLEFVKIIFPVNLQPWFNIIFIDDLFAGNVKFKLYVFHPNIYIVPELFINSKALHNVFNFQLKIPVLLSSPFVKSTNKDDSNFKLLSILFLV